LALHQFRYSNQFYVLAESYGLDFIDPGCGQHANIPDERLCSRGFTAGPCLLKDTLHLSALLVQFFHGHAAMLINEACQIFIVSHYVTRTYPIDALPS